MRELDLQEPDDVLAYLSSPIRAIRDALDSGVTLADTILNPLPPDDHLWAHVVRRGARIHLDKMTCSDWQRGRELAHSGIEVVKGPLVLRVFKSQRGLPPSPGRSATRQAFWSQQRFPNFCLAGAKMPDAANFILDWAVDEQRQLTLALSKPIGLWKYGQHPQLAWRRSVCIPEEDDLRFVPPLETDDLTIESVFDEEEFETGGEMN